MEPERHQFLHANEISHASANLRQRRCARPGYRVKPEDVVTGFALDYWAGFADRRLECPHAHIGNAVVSELEPLTFDNPVLRRHLESHATGHRVERGGITPLCRESFERVGTR